MYIPPPLYYYLISMGLHFNKQGGNGLRGTEFICIPAVFSSKNSIFVLLSENHLLDWFTCELFKLLALMQVAPTHPLLALPKVAYWCLCMTRRKEKRITSQQLKRYSLSPLFSLDGFHLRLNREWVKLWIDSLFFSVLFSCYCNIAAGKDGISNKKEVEKKEWIEIEFKVPKQLTKKIKSGGEKQNGKKINSV